MNKFKLIMLSLLIGLLGITPLQAALTTTTSIAVSATVSDPSPLMDFVIKELTDTQQLRDNPWLGADVTAMNFGTLTYLLANGANAGVWYSPKYYCVFIFTLGFGKQYQVTSSSNGLASATNSLPPGSFGLKPQYILQDSWTADGLSPQGAIPGGATLGNENGISAVGLNILIYRSEPAPSTDHIIRAFYSLPPFAPSGNPFPGYTPIPLSQPSGTYTGTVTITIAVI